MSEIVGWKPAATDVKVFGLKGDALNLNAEVSISSNPDDRLDWEFGKAAQGKDTRLSEIGHGQVLVREADATRAAVSFARVSQRATVSFAQLRRVELGRDTGKANAAGRALLVALGLHAHRLAFGHGFALRSGAELAPAVHRDVARQLWRRGDGNRRRDVHGRPFLKQGIDHARDVGVPLDGWGRDPVVLTPQGQPPESDPPDMTDLPID